MMCPEEEAVKIIMLAVALPENFFQAVERMHCFRCGRAMVVVLFAYRPQALLGNHFYYGRLYRQLCSDSGLCVESERSSGSLRTVPVGWCLIVVRPGHLHAGLSCQRAFKGFRGTDIWPVVNAFQNADIPFFQFRAREHVASCIPGHD